MNLRNFFERTFDARRVKRNHDEYDHRRCYQDYHAYCCRHASSREGFHSLASEASIEQHGLVPINGLLAPAIARELLENAIEVGELSLLKKNSRDLIGYRLRDITSVTRLLESVISDRVDTLSRTYFGCEYLVHWFMIAMTPPTRRPASVSFLWHCDKGPRAHLKLMVYLNDADEHGGGTAFLDRNDSAAVEASGYLFGAAKKRTAD